MSKIDELIQQYCPNGVEYKTLGEVVTLRRGVRVVKEQLVGFAENLFPVYQNCLSPMGYMEKYNCEANVSFIIAAGAAGQIGYSSERFWAADDCYYVINNVDISQRFIYHVLLNNQNAILSKVRRASIPRISRDSLAKITIPVPPLPVQEEIVRILDKFTELEARRRQYEYYRNKLLDFNELQRYSAGGGKANDAR